MTNALLCKTYAFLKSTEDSSQECTQLMFDHQAQIVNTIWQSFSWKAYGNFQFKSSDVQGAHAALAEAVGEISYKSVTMETISDVLDVYHYLGKFEFESKSEVHDFIVELNKRNISIVDFNFEDGRNF